MNFHKEFKICNEHFHGTVLSLSSNIYCFSDKAQFLYSYYVHISAMLPEKYNLFKILKNEHIQCTIVCKNKQHN